MMEYGIVHRIPHAYRTEAVHTKISPTYQEMQPGYTKNTNVRATAIISEVHRGSEARLKNYIGRPSSEKIIACSDSLSDAFSGMPHQSLQPSFTSRVSRFTSFVL
ncbi:hypothetical protein pdam_00004302 [Pocillopora damicornis]|uniref:Uncharacterized protein n=1 Tax=Pocillopora damicornis TaxID=46731 RepID=A0A3M6T8E8_POCDA|nr:hypothetical protein pdam_00004302 [Pocillopora damicornis]